MRSAPAYRGGRTGCGTGGTGGFGAATAQWLVGLGARPIALVSRRGPDAPEAAVTLDALRERGVRATAYAADAADPMELMRSAGGTITDLAGMIYLRLNPAGGADASLPGPRTDATRPSDVAVAT
ncbi:KR domain-containing protein [Streptomyces sp. NPDC058284]|uniref:KR domain-containing protein n=1 Tax=unclassified Streptomyces TaxID=2593676 RepID=UPI0036531279